MLTRSGINHVGSGNRAMLISYTKGSSNYNNARTRKRNDWNNVHAFSSQAVLDDWIGEIGGKETS